MARHPDTKSLKDLRHAAGKTIRQVALDLGVPERNYVRWEQGDTLPSAENLVRVADYFGVHPRTLVPAPDLVAREGRAS